MFDCPPTTNHQDHHDLTPPCLLSSLVLFLMTDRELNILSHRTESPNEGASSKIWCLRSRHFSQLGATCDDATPLHLNYLCVSSILAWEQSGTGLSEDFCARLWAAYYLSFSFFENHLLVLRRTRTNTNSEPPTCARNASRVQYVVRATLSRVC